MTDFVGRSLDDLPPLGQALDGRAVLVVVDELRTWITGADGTPGPDDDVAADGDVATAALHFAGTRLWLGHDWQTTLRDLSAVTLAVMAGGGPALATDGLPDRFDHGRPIEDMPPLAVPLSANALLNHVGRLTAWLSGIDYAPSPAVSGLNGALVALWWAALLLWVEDDWERALDEWSAVALANAVGCRS
jgi:hypothetical protein